ncbi:uncharacterized protein [Argopecten irradians]|uniref:uncharacterized protein isoform X2 n=1 Tax=Argopecten irradians TaxID=31199 RepID=UPI003722DDCC
MRAHITLEIQAPLKSLTDLTEKELSIVVTNHLFGQLSTTSRFLINVNNSGPKTCPCNTGCDSPCSFGDTSIGNEEVWHGNMDVILNQEVAINTVNDESNPSTSDPGNSDPGHFSSHVRRLSRNSEFIAKTVSFSFLQRQSRPEISLSLFPCISITSNGLVLDFYDSNHDVLLESSAIPFIIPGKESTSRTISLTMIIVAWLAVNYRYLSSGLPATLKYEAAKAGFFEQAGDKLRVYRGELKLGNVRDSVCFNDDSDSDVESPEFLSEIRARLYNIAKGKGVGRDGDAIYISHSNQ